MNGNREFEKHASDFIRGLKKRENTTKLNIYLGESTKEDIIHWKDDENNDLMHHCILCNSPEAVEFLLSRGYFQEPFEPSVNPYLHFAALLGHRTVLNILLNNRLNDYRPSDLLRYPEDGHNSKFGNSHKVTPLDVAATAGHLDCVHLILNQRIIKANPDYATSGYVTLATIANSPIAVKLLLKNKPDTKDIKEGIKYAVHSANPECLDLLLATKTKTDDIFDRVNMYHILYSYSSAKHFSKSGYAQLPEVTSVLIKHKIPVNAKEPTNTFPIYSLLRNSLCIRDYIHTRYYIECLKLLLKNGADPNFDEVKYEKLRIRKGRKSLVGRQAFSSALHCLLNTVEIYAEYLDSKALATRFVVECADILVQNRANVNQIGRIGDNTSSMMGTVLHQFAKTSVVSGTDDEIMRFFLREGADADSKADDKYVINTFADKLFETIALIPPYKEERPDYTEDVEKMLEICKHMSRPALKEAYKLLKKRAERSHLPSDSERYYKIMSNELNRHVKSVWSLKRLSSTFVWGLCKRDAHNVHLLPINPKLKTDILPIL